MNVMYLVEYYVPLSINEGGYRRVPKDKFMCSSLSIFNKYIDEYRTSRPNPYLSISSICRLNKYTLKVVLENGEYFTFSEVKALL